MKSKFLIFLVVVVLSISSPSTQARADIFPEFNATTWLQEVAASGGPAAAIVLGVGYLVVQKIYEKSSFECWGKCFSRVRKCCTGEACKKEPTSIMDPFIPQDLNEDLRKLITLMGRGVHKAVESSQGSVAREAVGTEEKPIFAYDLPTGQKLTFISMKDKPEWAQKAQEQLQAKKEQVVTVKDYDAFSQSFYGAFAGYEGLQNFTDKTREYFGSWKSRLQNLFDQGYIRLMTLNEGTGQEADLYFLGNPQLRVHGTQGTSFDVLYLIRVEHAPADDLDFLGIGEETLTSAEASTRRHATRRTGAEERLLRRGGDAGDIQLTADSASLRDMENPQEPCIIGCRQRLSPRETTEELF